MPEATGVAVASQASREALERMRRHHRAMVLELGARVDGLVDAAATGRSGDEERAATLDYLRTDVLPHAKAEETTVYAAAADGPAGLLVSSMIMEHERLASGVGDLDVAEGPIRQAIVARSLELLFELHQRKENELLLPALLEAGADLAGLLERMEAALTNATAEARAGAGEIDVRELPHASRHDRIFAGLEELAVGQEMVIVNDHDPQPLRFQIEALWPETFEWTYRVAGPDVWKVSIGRRKGA